MVVAPPCPASGLPHVGFDVSAWCLICFDGKRIVLDVMASTCHPIGSSMTRKCTSVPTRWSHGCYARRLFLDRMLLLGRRLFLGRMLLLARRLFLERMLLLARRLFLGRMLCTEAISGTDATSWAGAISRTDAHSCTEAISRTDATSCTEAISRTDAMYGGHFWNRCYFLDGGGEGAGGLHDSRHKASADYRSRCSVKSSLCS